mmetsp:Transcript_27687/g.26704  ORF Transcript_27687/g.26704 Transcript_27687/m.26704 type:complete len:120 (+) Transcript_27687:1070-1429(+)
MFFRFLVIQSIFLLLLYLPLTLGHVVRFEYNRSDLCDAVISIPCTFFYSRFSQNQAIMYSMTLSFFVVCGSILCLYEFVMFDLLKTERELYEVKNIKFTKMVLNAWNWQMNNGYDSRQF